MKFKIRKTISLGTGIKHSSVFEALLREKGCIIGNEARRLLQAESFKPSIKRHNIELVITSVADLGYENAPLELIYAKARSVGLGLCPPEVGPQLRLQFMDQPKQKDWITIAMKPITLMSCPNERYDLRMFCLGHDDTGIWLSTVDADPQESWFDIARFVFVNSRTPC